MTAEGRVGNPLPGPGETDLHPRQTAVVPAAPADPPPEDAPLDPAGAPAAPGADRLAPGARRSLPWLTAARFASNVGVRFPITFIEPLARGVGVHLDTMGVVLGLRELTGLVGPAAGRHADRGRRNRLILAGLGGCALTMALGALSPGAVVVSAALVAFGFAKATHDVASNGWIGEHVPFARRGLVTGLVETSWAAALLLGVPIIGVLLDDVGWRAPFVATAAMCLVPFVALPRLLGRDTRPGEEGRRAMPSDDGGPPNGDPGEGVADAAAQGTDPGSEPPRRRRGEVRPRPGPTVHDEPAATDHGAPQLDAEGQLWSIDDGSARAPRRRRATMATIAALGLMALAMQLVTVSFGPWLEDAFGFSVAAVGSASIAFGLGETAGTLGAARFSDRLGKRRAVLIGMVVMVPGVVALPAVAGDTWVALGLFTVVSAGFELAFVSTLPLLSQLEPDARSTIIGRGFATFTATRALATAAGAFAFERWGMGAVAVTALGVLLGAIAVLGIWGEEPTG